MKSLKLILIILISLGAIYAFGFWLWNFTTTPDSLAGSLKTSQAIAQGVTDDFMNAPLQAFEKKEESFQVIDSKINGPKIETAQALERDKQEEDFVVDFPIDYKKPLEIKLDPKRSIRITDNNSVGFSSKLLTASDDKENKNRNDLMLKSGEEIADTKQFLQYSSSDKRKNIYYAYQRESEKKQIKIKNWIVYQKGDGRENESYTIENAKLRLNKTGDVEGFYMNSKQEIKNEKVKNEVSGDLMERARIVLAKDSNEEIEKGNREPDFIIPRPYLLDKDGKRQDLDWKISDKVISVDFEVSKDQYPIALDPTITLNKSIGNFGNFIQGESVNGEFGYPIISGDFNGDGKTDLAVGASAYSSNAGRVYIFYNDGSIPTTAAAADVVITGEASSYFGNAMTSGDFDSDGKMDLAVGAGNYSSNMGRVYIFYNDGSMPTTAATADFIITGEASSYLGKLAMTSGDFNSDGKTDLAVGAYGYSTSTGRAYIFYNDGSIPSTAATADVIITGEATSNSFGWSLSSGDFNDDNKIDLVVGSICYSSCTGRAYIFYNDGSIPTTAATADVIITGETTNNTFGGSLAVGDFNSDGKTDLAVGAYRYSSFTGRAYIFYNDGSIPTTAATADVIITGEATNNYFGSSLVVGDFNSDGKTDLAVGAYGYSSDTGRAYIFYNDGSIPTTAATADIIITGETINSNFASSLASGDFNADGKTDLAVDAWGHSSSTGRAYIFYQVEGSFSYQNPVSSSPSLHNETTSSFSVALESGDLNGDGKADLIVGASDYHTGPVYGTGKVYVFYGGSSIKTSASAADVILTGAENDWCGEGMLVADLNADTVPDFSVACSGKVYVFYGGFASELTAADADLTITQNVKTSYFGASMAAADFNGDNLTDLVINSARSDTQRGALYVFFMDGSVPTTDQTADIIITGETAGDYFGEKVSLADMNADGKDDIIVGASEKNSSTGSLYVFYNDGTIPTSASNADLIISGEATGNYFGYELDVKDLNFDGIPDIAASSLGYSSNSGRVYIFYNDGSIPSSASSADVIITGEPEGGSYGGRLGENIEIGDYNGDGKNDLVISATGYEAGRAYIFFGDNIVSSISPETDADVVIAGDESLYYWDFGWFIKGGDFNGDGTDDLAVSKDPWSDGERVYLFFGGVNIATSAVSADITIASEARADYFGDNMTSGDLNGDGFTDLVVASYYEHDRVYIFYGGTTLPFSNDEADVVISGIEYSYFGSSLACGDLNGDGKDDLIVGTSSSTHIVYIFYGGSSMATTAAAANVTINGATNVNFGAELETSDVNGDGIDDLITSSSGYNSNTGRVYVFYGGSSIRTTDATANVIITGGAVSNWFGGSLAVGDLNSDGIADIAVSATGYSFSMGRVYVFYGGNSISTTAATANVTITGWVSFGSFGRALATGDFNGDGRKDLAASENVNYGQVRIFNNDGSYPTGAASADFVIKGESATYGKFGLSSLRVGDFNDDRRDDLVVSSYFDVGYASRVYIFYGGIIATQASLANIIIEKDANEGDLGKSIAVGDFNGGGKTDLAISLYDFELNAYAADIIYFDKLSDATKMRGNIKMRGNVKFK